MITDHFIEELHRLSQSIFSEKTTRQAKRCLLDYLGATLAGSKMLGEKGARLLTDLDNMDGKCKAIGFNRRTGIQQAALINGFSAHIAEMDDGYRYGAIHPGATILSALLPLAEKEGLTGKDLIRGIVWGYEAAIRISRAMQPALKNRGYHATGVCGTIGSAMAVAAALNFPAKQMKDALSAAATGATGILKVIREGSQLKPLNAAQAAANGLIAAFVARAGFEGPTDVLGGEKGFLEVKAVEYNEEHLFKNSYDQPGIHDIYVKPYAACRHSHPAVDAVLHIRNKYNVQPLQVKEIEINTYAWAVHLHDHTDISGIASAKMSTPYSVAIALIDGKAGIEQFMPERLQDPDVLSLTKKVNVVESKYLNALVPDKRAAIVDVVTQSGERFTRRIDLPKGEPENPLTQQELEEKFSSLAIFSGKSIAESERITDITMQIETRLSELFDYL
jgi:2-methylcitrate dehydratase PrpD